MRNRAPNPRRIPPDELREVAPRLVPVRVIVRILGVLLVPAVHHGARKLEPRLVVVGRGPHGGEIAAGAVLRTQLIIRPTFKIGFTLFSTRFFLFSDSRK